MINPKVSAILIIIILAVGIIYFDPLNLDILGDEDYGTGIDVEVDNAGVRLGEEGLVGNIRSPSDELIQQGDDSPVVTSFRVSTNQDYWSEQITIQGSITNTGAGGLIWPHLEYSYYRIYIKTDPVMAWKPIVDTSKGIFDDSIIHTMGGLTGYHDWAATPSVGETVDMQAFSFKIIGPVVGALKCEVVTQVHDAVATWINWKVVTSRDYIYLISGEGTAGISGYSPTDVPMFALGETVPITYDVGYSGNTGFGSGGWELHYKPRDGRSGGLITTLNDDSNGVYNWALPSDIWHPGITDSKVDILLYNTLFKVNGVLINTIDFRANAPPTPTVSVDNAEIFIGDSVTVTGTCNVNSLTNEEIQNFHIRIVYLTRNYEMGYWNNVPASGDPASFTFATPGFIYSGDAQIQIWAHDEGGRESEFPAKINIRIKTPTEGEETLSINLIVALIIIGIGGIVALLYPGDIKFKVAIFLVFVAIAIAVWYMVDFTPLEDWIASKWWL